MNIEKLRQLTSVISPQEKIDYLQKQVKELKDKIRQGTNNSLLATKRSDEIFAATKSLYDYLSKQKILYLSDGISVDEQHYHIYLYMAIIVDALENAYYEMTENELLTISDQIYDILQDTQKTPQEIPKALVSFVDLYSSKFKTNPYLKIIKVTLEDWKIFIRALPPVEYHKKINYQKYLNAQAPKIIQKLLKNKDFESKDINSIKILLQELKKDKQKHKPNENIHIYYSMPTYIKDIAFNRHDAYETKMKMLKYLTPTFDNDDNLNKGHIKQEAINELVEQKKDVI